MSTSRALAGRQCLSRPSNILFQAPQRSFRAQTRPQLPRPQIRPRTYFSLTPGPAHLPTISPTVRSTISHAGPEQLLGATVILGLLYSIAWALDFSPSSLIFDEDVNPYVFLPELNHRLESVVLPAELDLSNDSFFALLSRSRPLRYGFYLREAQANAKRAKTALEGLEKELQGTRCACKSPADQERRRELRKALKKERECVMSHRERWVKLWILDLKEGGSIYRRRRGKTVVGTVRRWMGWDLEANFAEMVQMGIIKV